MKYITEYRDAHLVKGVLDEIHQVVTKPWVIMEICGGQTHAIVRHGIDQLLPDEVELVHGPGCPAARCASLLWNRSTRHLRSRHARM